MVRSRRAASAVKQSVNATSAQRPSVATSRRSVVTSKARPSSERRDRAVREAGRHAANAGSREQLEIALPAAPASRCRDRPHRGAGRAACRERSRRRSEPAWPSASSASRTCRVGDAVSQAARASGRSSATRCIRRRVIRRVGIGNGCGDLARHDPPVLDPGRLVVGLRCRRHRPTPRSRSETMASPRPATVRMNHGVSLTIAWPRVTRKR